RSRTMASLNGWGQQGWWCLQIINMAEGREPDLDLGVFKAFTGYQASEKKAAAAYNAHWNG
ncbi:NADH:flavin oxidoreductase, partial [Alphaproteobacteria bacterium]|nr:NADH:flavin oxidoreductase [Alphaproteobacteria bacterium]